MRRIAIAVLLCVLGSAGAAHANGFEERLMGFGDKGLTVGGTVIFDKAVGGAVYDAAQDLVWFTSKGTLQVIDLRASTIKPIVIAKRFPAGPFAIEGASEGAFQTTYGGVFPIVVVGKKAKVRTGSGAYADIWEDQAAQSKKQIRRIKLVGRTWLKKQQGRKLRVARPVAAKPLPDVALPKGMGECEEDDLCGAAEPFGATAYQLVTVSLTCGDACHTTCALYDPARKLFVTPDASAGSWAKTAAGGACDDYGIDGSRGKYFIGSKLCSVAQAGVKCVDTGWSLFGWLDAAGPAAPPK